jgi:hypothetical protein
VFIAKPASLPLRRFMSFLQNHLIQGRHFRVYNVKTLVLRVQHAWLALFRGRSGLRSARMANQSSERPPLKAREACRRSN